MTVDPTIHDGTSHASLEPSARQLPPAEAARIARAAGIIALGNVTSRLLGLARETVKSHYFGAGGAVDAFNVASIVPTMLFDLLVGGMVNSSLVPVFSEYAEDRREELWRLVSALLSLTVIVMAAFILVVELFAPQVAFLLSSGSSPEVLDLAARLLRITVPAVLFLSLSGVLSGLLYALKRFTFPAFSAAIFNAGMVLLTLLLHNRLGIAAMAVGLLVGTILQMALQLSGLRDANLRFRFNLAHSGLRRVAILYMPIALGLLVDILISRPISYNLASQTGEGGISWMTYATFLRQLPQGLVATAISFAVLPTLSVHASKERTAGDGGPFQTTLAQGLRLVTVLIIPASVGLFILARPIVALLYEHGDFVAYDTEMTALALQYYLLGLPFAAIDLLLVFAFYARQDTLTPSLIGVGTVVVYLAAAIALMPIFGLFSLMIADSLKQLLHMLIAALILGKRLDGLGKDGIRRTLGLTLSAVAVMGLAAYGALLGVERLLPGGGGLAELLAVAVPGLVGVALYLGMITLLRVEEVRQLWAAIRRRIMR
jgi:putative peptidoglycan lipid II flippase